MEEILYWDNEFLNWIELNWSQSLSRTRKEEEEEEEEERSEA
jgi:hypothetical protein